MKFIFNITILVFYSSIFSQVSIDTTEIKSQRYEWKINLKTSDSALSLILTEYKSGILKEEYYNNKNGQIKKYMTNVFESKTEYLNRDLKGSIKVHYFSMIDTESKYYYDKNGILDSFYSKYYIDSLKEISRSITKKFDENDKLIWLINLNGSKEFYKYDSENNISVIEIYDDTTLYEIKTYKNGYLTEQNFPTRKKYRKKFTYKYDENGLLLIRNDNDHHFWNYYYDDKLLIKKEKIYKKKNMAIEYFTYEYDSQKRLNCKKKYRLNNELLEMYKYQYK